MITFGFRLYVGNNFRKQALLQQRCLFTWYAVRAMYVQAQTSHFFETGEVVRPPRRNVCADAAAQLCEQRCLLTRPST